MTLLVFTFLVVVVLILVLLAIRKFAVPAGADGNLEAILEGIAILIAILVILDHAGLLHQ